MAVEIVASVVTQKLGDMLSKGSISNEKVIKCLNEINKNLADMKGYLLNVQDKHPNDINVKKWAEDYLTHLYKVEDAIDIFYLRIARRGRLGFLVDGLFLKNSAACWMLSRKIKRIRVKIENLKGQVLASGLVEPPVAPSSAEKKHGEEEHEPNRVSRIPSVGDATICRDRYKQAKLMYSYSYYEEELDFVGFKRQVDTLVTRLTRGESTDGFVPIVGEKGSGKTTLARAVYGNRQVQNSFGCRAWVTLSKDYDAINLYRNLLKQVGETKDHDVRIDEKLLKKALLKRLSEKKYLIVLDDVRKSSIWEYLRGASPSNTNGSKVLFTCRELEEGYPNSSPIRMKSLNEEDSWKLFSRKAGWDLSGSSPPDKPWKTIEAWNCLPLNIVLNGSLLSAQNVEGLERWIEKMSHKESWKTDEIIKSCYDNLTDLSKLCLLYMVLFPPELDIPVRRLLRLWQAEGFVKGEDAQKIFYNLVKRSLIQVSKMRSDGRPRKCRLLGVLREFLLPKALDVKLFHVHPENSNASEGKCPGHVRRLVEYRDIDHCSFYQSQHTERLRSFLSFNDRKKDTPAKEVGNLLDHIMRNGKPLLRVLDLEGLYKPSLPENLGDLFGLRYLGLRWTFLDTLPQSVGNLYNLETLDVKHTYIETLPSSIWKLKHLQHLNLNNKIHQVPKNMPSSLPDLLTLWGLSVDEGFLDEVGLNSLTELGITFRWTQSSCCEKLLDWILKLNALQQLKLQSVDDNGYPGDLIFKPLSGLKELYYLYLLGKLSKLPETQDFPQGIKVLTLSVSCMDHDPMPILEQLPSLTVLRLLRNSYRGQIISCRRGGFKELQVLKLWLLEELEVWELEEGAMVNLKELNLRFCKRLKDIPRGLLQQEKFKELTFTDMPEEVSMRASAKVEQEKKKSHHIDFKQQVTSNNYSYDDGYLFGVDSK